MTTKLLIASFIFASVLSSCSSNDEPSQSVIPSDSFEVPFDMTIKYDGITYNVKAMLEGDSLIYLDEEFSNIYNTEIKNIPNKAVLTYKDDNNNDVVEYYTTEKQMFKAKGMSFFGTKIQEPTLSRGGESNPVAANCVGRACLYDDKTFKDRDVTLDITQNLMCVIPDLKVYANFNDKTSSIRVFNFLKPNNYYTPLDPTQIKDPETQAEKGYLLRTCLIGYENTNYGGSKLFCVSREAKDIDLSLSLEEMKKVYHCDWRLSKIGWNDKISSVVFRIVRVEDVNGTIIVPHPSF